MNPYHRRSCIFLIATLIMGFNYPVSMIAQEQDLSKNDRRMLKKSIRLIKKDQYQEAYNNLYEIYLINPSHIKLTRHLGECCFYLNQPENAIRFFNESVHLIDINYGMSESPSKKNAKYQKMKEIINSRIADCQKIIDESENPLPVRPTITTVPATQILLDNQVSGDQIMVDNEMETIEDLNQNLIFKSNRSNPISLFRYNLHASDSTWVIPSEKELRILLQTLISQGLLAKTFLTNYSTDTTYILPYLTADFKFEKGTEMYTCLKVVEGEIFEVKKENIEAVIVLLKRNLQH